MYTDREIPNLTNFAATLLSVMGVEPLPHMAPPVASLAERLRSDAGGGKIEKALVFHVDAVPAYVVDGYGRLFEPVRAQAGICAEFSAVMPSITPVCFAAMYSGAAPDRNGVPRYLSPVLTPEKIQPRIRCETVVEALVRAGKRVAVITCSNGCIASMLYGRGAEMFIIDGDDDAAMYAAGMRALKSGEYDVIFLYQLSYDYTMHAHGPRSDEAIGVLSGLTARFGEIAAAARETWREARKLVVFNSDHGCHPLTGDPAHKGMHGDDIPEDMRMKWFFGAYAPEAGRA